MRIKMLETCRGAEDGFTVRQYHRGELYDVADTLARGFIRNNRAVSVEPMPTADEIVGDLLRQLKATKA